MAMMPTDNHVHSRWSWDTATSSSMQLACARAVEIGLPGLAFTEHVDFTEWTQQDSAELAGPCGPTVTQPTRIGARPRVAPLDVEGYSADLARCREEFPDLRILAGIEAGEPHLFPASVAAVLAAGNFEQVLGSLHGIVYDGTLTGIDDVTGRPHGPAATPKPISRRNIGRCFAPWHPRGARWRSIRVARWRQRTCCAGGGRRVVTQCRSAATLISRFGSASTSIERWMSSKRPASGLGAIVSISGGGDPS
jgi:hypothetical protein